MKFGFISGSVIVTFHHEKRMNRRIDHALDISLSMLPIMQTIAYARTTIIAQI